MLEAPCLSGTTVYNGHMKKLITVLAVIGIIVIVFGTMYGIVQQAQRNDANYPQIQMAEDTAALIGGGTDPYVASTLSPVNMKSSLAPFTIVYDKKGNVVSGSGYLNGKVPRRRSARCRMPEARLTMP